MIRKFNYTDRKTLTQSNIDITLFKGDKTQSFNITFNIKDLGLPSEASIYVEPYYKSSYMRFNYGRVGNITPPETRELTDIPYSDVIYFRIKIVDESEKHGKILAQISQIRPGNKEEDENKESILPVNYEANLDQEVWRVSFEESKPILEINKNIKNKRELVAGNQFFKSLVFPSVVRQVASEIINTSTDYSDEGDLWQNKWLRFFKNNLGVKEVPDHENSQYLKNQWVDAVGEAFARKYHLLDNFVKFKN